MFIEAFDYAKVAVDGEGNPYLLNPETRVNRISGSNVNGNYDRITNKYLEVGSYLRVKNISVNYTLPQKLLGNQNVVRNVRVGASVQNAFTITGYSGYDPRSEERRVGKECSTVWLLAH